MSSSDSIDELKMFGLQMRAYSTFTDFYKRNNKQTLKCYKVFVEKFLKKYHDDSEAKLFNFIWHLCWVSETYDVEQNMMSACLNCTNVDQLNDIIYCFGLQNTH